MRDKIENFVDNLLLGYIQRSADFLEELMGICRVKLAFFFFFLSVCFCVISIILFIGTHQDFEDNFLFGYIVLGPCFLILLAGTGIFLFWEYLPHRENYQSMYRNSLSLIWSSFRKISFFLLVESIVISFFVQWNYCELLIFLDCFCNVLCVYLLSTDLKPPSKSKIRKLLDKIKEFGLSPIPQPG